jgi:hypothetical protein
MLLVCQQVTKVFSATQKMTVKLASRYVFEAL